MKKRISALTAALTVAVSGLMPATLTNVQASVFNGNDGSYYTVQMNEEVENWCDVTGFSVTLKAVDTDWYSFSGLITVSGEETVSTQQFSVYNSPYSTPRLEGDLVDCTIGDEGITLILDHGAAFFEDMKDVEDAVGKIRIESWSDAYVTDITYYYTDGSTSGGEISYRERPNMKVNLRKESERWYALNGITFTATLEDDWTDIGLNGSISFSAANLYSLPSASFSSYGGEELHLYSNRGELSYEIADNVMTMTFLFDEPYLDQLKYDPNAQVSMQIKSTSGAYFTIDDVSYLYDDSIEDVVYVRVNTYQITSDGVLFFLNTRELPYGSTYSNLITGGNYSVKTSDLPEDTIIYSGWFSEPDGGRILTSNSKLISSEEHSIYQQALPVAAHYVKFDAGEGDLIWTSSKNTYTGNVRAIAEDEMIVPDQSCIQDDLPRATWGTHAFVGWFTEPEGGEMLTNETVIEGDTDITYYAQYDDEDTTSERDQIRVRRYNMVNGSPVFMYDTLVAADSTYGSLFYSSSPAYSNVIINEEFELGTAAATDWYTAETGGHIVDYYSDELIPGDTAIYQRREVYPCHYISFDAGEGEIFWSFSHNTYYPGNVPAEGNLQALVMEEHRVGGLPTAEYGTHAFLGWFTEPDGGTQFTNSTLYTEKGDITLYAHWDEADTTDAPQGIKVRIYNQNTSTGEYIVSRDYRGTDTSSYNALMYGSGNRPGSVTTVKTPSSTGIPDGMMYVYNYYDQAEGGNIVLLSDPLITEEDHALYYRRELVPYHYVTFDANGGSLLWKRIDSSSGSGTPSTMIAPGKSGSLNIKNRTLADNEMIIGENNSFAAMPSAENGTREFLGWFTAAEGGEQIETGTPFTEDKDITLYAHWSDEGQVAARDTVKISYYSLNQNTGEYELCLDELVSQDMTYSMVSNPSVSSYNRIHEEIPAGKMAVFGWYTEPDGGKPVKGNLDTVKSEDHALYYHYEIVGYHYVTFNPGSGTLSKYVEASGDSEYPHTTTAKVAASSGTTSTTVKQPASNQILVTEGALYGELPKAYWAGHDFLGWFTAKQGGVQVTEDTLYTATSDQTLYARWSNDDTPIPQFTRGDFDGNGKIDVIDSQNVLLIYAELLVGNTPDLTEQEFGAADVDEDGEIKAIDAQLILLYYAYNTLAGEDTTWEQLLADIK